MTRRGDARPFASVLVAVALLSSPLSAEDGADSGSPLDSLAWMVGCWGADDGDATTDECWYPRRGALMIGFHVDLHADGRVFYEYLRITADESGVTYRASPLGAEATSFALVHSGPRRAVFENPSHDWPQRITYWRQDDRLHARAEGLDPARRQAEWVWRSRPLTPR